MYEGPTIFPFIDHFPNCGRCPTVFATVYEYDMGDGKGLEDLSHTMASTLRKGKCRHKVDGFVEMGQLARYLRVTCNDVAAVVGCRSAAELFASAPRTHASLGAAAAGLRLQGVMATVMQKQRFSQALLEFTRLGLNV